jgi:predicted nucleic acid-binding protein
VAEPRSVVNTSPIVLLAAADALSLLPQVVGEILLPDAVVEEIVAGKILPPALAGLRSSSWVHVEPRVPVPAEVAGWDLGLGETQVLALALARGGVQVVLDDLQARRCAQSLGLPTTGTLGVILRAKRRRLIPAARPVLEKLVDRGLYLAHELMEMSLAEVGE